MFGDENYVNKFGALKRGLVLMSYGRYNDAHQVLAKAVFIVKQQKLIEIEKLDCLKERWQFKLGLDDLEIPYPIDKVHPDDVTDKKLQKDIGGLAEGVQISTVRLYWENISPFKTQEGSKDTFLNM